MSQLHSEQIKSELVRRFKAHVDMSKLANTSTEEREHVFVSRALSAYVIGNVARISDQTAAACITDGSQDQGIDAVYFDQDEKILYLVQSKWRRNNLDKGIALKEVQSFIEGIRLFLDSRFDQFSIDFQMKAVPHLHLAHKASDARVYVVLAHNGVTLLHDDARARLNDLEQELNDVTHVFSWREVSQAELHEMVRLAHAPESIDLTIVLHEYGTISEPYRAVYGYITAADIAVWWKQYGTALFTRNVRGLLDTHESEVNVAIQKTLEDSPEKFWYFNNGITVLCKSMSQELLGVASKGSIATLTMRGIAIVNGAQTVGSIGSLDVGFEDKLAQARVMSRFIAVNEDPSDLSLQVTRAANTQNRIERRDFVSLDREQERLRLDMLLGLDKRYLLKRGDPEMLPAEGCSVDEATIALACEHSVALATQAKREVGALWLNIEKAPYVLLFNAKTTAERLWGAVIVMRAVDGWLAEKRSVTDRHEVDCAVHGNRLVLHLVFYRLAKSVSDIEDRSLESLYSSALKEVPHAFADIVAEMRSHYSSAQPSSLFKNQKKCEVIIENIVNPSNHPEVESSPVDLVQERLF